MEQIDSDCTRYRLKDKKNIKGKIIPAYALKFDGKGVECYFRFKTNEIEKETEDKRKLKTRVNKKGLILVFVR